MLKKVKRVLERDGWRCRKCGSLENLQVHHKVHRRQQGDDPLANLITLCVHCHIKVHGQLYFEPQVIRITVKPTPRRSARRSL